MTSTSCMDQAISADHFSHLQNLLEAGTAAGSNPQFRRVEDVEEFEDITCSEFHTTVDGILIKVRLTKAPDGAGNTDHFVDVAAALGNTFRLLKTALPAVATVNEFLGIE